MQNTTSQLSRGLLQLQMCLNQSPSEYSSRRPALTRLRPVVAAGLVVIAVAVIAGGDEVGCREGSGLLWAGKRVAWAASRACAREVMWAGELGTPRRQRARCHRWLSFSPPLLRVQPHRTHLPSPFWVCAG